VNQETLLRLIWDAEDDQDGAALALAVYLEVNGHGGDLIAELRESARYHRGELSGPNGHLIVHFRHIMKDVHERLIDAGVLPGKGDPVHHKAWWFRANILVNARGHNLRHQVSLFPTPESRADACRQLYGALKVACYPERPTPPAVRVEYPKSPYPIYAPGNDRASRGLSLWLTNSFPRYPRVTIGEPADLSLLHNFDWVVL
jgi:hypothetical protein